MKSAEETIKILDAYDLIGSFRDAAELVGCSHHTVARYMAAREQGRLAGDGYAARSQLIDGFLPKVEEWVDQSHGKIRGDKAHEKLLTLGYTGSERTTRRAVAEVKAAYAAGHRRSTARGSPSRDVAAVRLRRRSGRGPGEDDAVRAMAGVVPVSGHVGVGGQRRCRR